MDRGPAHVGLNRHVGPGVLAVGLLAAGLGAASAGAGVVRAPQSATHAQSSIEQAEQYVALVGQAGGAAHAVAVDGDHVIVGVGAQLVIVDAADPSATHEVYRSDVLRQMVSDIDVEDHIPYVAHGSQLMILDVTQPEAPLVESDEWFYYGDDIRRVVVHDGVAYILLQGLSPLAIVAIDVRDPETPTRISWPGPPDYGQGPFGRPQDIAAQGTYVYAVGSAGLVIVDVTDPAAPVRVGEANVAATAYAVEVEGDYAFVASDPGPSSAGGGLLIYDVSNPAQPNLVGEVGLRARSVAVDGGFAYVALSPGDLAVVDVADPAHPVAVRTEPFGVISDLVAEGSRTFVAELDRGVTMLHGTPAPPAERSQVFETWSPVVDVVTPGDGALAYAAYDDGLAIVDLTTPADPRTAGMLTLPGGVEHLAVDGDTAFLSTAAGAVEIVSVADAGAPLRLGSVATDGSAEALAASDGLLVVAEPARLRVFDVSLPAQPREVGSLAQDGWEPTGLLVADGFAYVADRPVGLRAFELSATAAPLEVGSLAFRTSEFGRARGMARAGTRLYVPHGPESVATPAAEPAAAPNCPPPPPPDEFRVLEIDISDPTSLSWTTDLAPTGWPKGLAVADDILFVASGYARYYTTALYARGNGPNAGLEMEAVLPTVPRGAAALGHHVLVAADEAGLLVAEVRSGSAPTLTPAATREPSPTSTVDPNATATPTSANASRTPFPTPTGPATLTPEPTVTPIGTRTPTDGAILYLPHVRR